MKLLRLAASNFKRLSALELEFDPEGGLVVISGKNGAGKTCAMDILAASIGGAKLCPKKPIKDGETEGFAEAETDEWTATRRFRIDGSDTLKVVKSDQSIVPKGQTFLDSVIGKIAFDPLAFVYESDAKKQRKTLLDLVGVDLTELDAKIKGLREQRTAVGRTLKQAEAEVEASETFPDVPDAEISAETLRQEIQTASDHNYRARTIRDSITNMEDRIQGLHQELHNTQTELSAGKEWLLSHPPVSASDMDGKLKGIEETNRQVRANVENKKLIAHALEVSKGYNELVQGIKDQEIKKHCALLEASMPVAGLSVSEDGVTFNGIPIAQIAESEKIKVGMAVSMALNPTLKVLLIRDGSLLDPDNMKLIEEMVKAKDFQALIERVSDGTDQTGFIIEDGTLQE